MRVDDRTRSRRQRPGEQRFFLNFTFCNPRADTTDLGHVPCIRPGYKRQMTLADLRTQLNLDVPFETYGDGLIRVAEPLVS